MCEAAWVNLIYDTAYRFHEIITDPFKVSNYGFICIFFISFHFISTLIILSLIKGLVWEIFTVV